MSRFMGLLPQNMSHNGLICKSTDLISSRRTRICFSFATVLACGLIFFYRTCLERVSAFRAPSPGAAIHVQVPETNDVGLPRLLSTVLPPHVGPVYNFSVPHLMTYYEDELPNDHTRLMLITSGIMMDYSKRNFSAAGCLVGDDLYPATEFISEVIHCVIPRRLQPGEKLAPVLKYDDVLKRAEAGPVTLFSGIVAELFPGDISKLSDKTVLHGELSSSGPDDFRVARSSHRVGASDHYIREEAKYQPRYQLCQMTMVAPNSHMIKDWANYHRRIGVDKIFIFDNGAELDLKKMFKGRPDVEVVTWPYHKSQVQAVSAFLLMARARCERIFMHDSDEYMMFGLGDGTCLTTGERPLIRYVKKMWKKGFKHVKVLYLVMSSSGFLRRPTTGEVPENFIHRREKQLFRNGKSICFLDSEDWQAGSIHQCGYSGGARVRTYFKTIKAWGDLKMRPEELDDPPFLLHYRERSWEEWIEKWDAGRVSGKEVADPKAGKFSMDEPSRTFLATAPELKYTHFRDNIYYRVMKDGRADEQIVVQTKEGKRCEMLYKIVGKRVTGPVRETCAKTAGAVVVDA